MNTSELLTTYHRRRLIQSAGGKPLDFAGGGLTGSVNHDGRLTALNGYHPAHGYVTLTTALPFPEGGRYNPAAVRAYRAGLATLEGFGLSFATPIVGREAWLVEDAVPHLRLTLADGSTAECTTFIPVDTPVGLIQIWRFSRAGMPVRLSGRVSLQRCAYTQLTEGGPLPMPSHETRPFYPRSGGPVGLVNPALGWAVVLSATEANPNPDGTLMLGGAPLTAPGCDPAMPEIALFIAPGSNPDEAWDTWRRLAEDSSPPAELLRRTLDMWQARWIDWPHAAHPLDAVLRRALVYALACAVPVPGKAAGDALCLLTDHQLLPLSWNRDSYYAALALLRWRREMAEVVRRHLLWLFEVAERPGGAWGRSYLANGQLKDPIFQLDQQIFPLLELADYVDATGDHAMLARLGGHADLILAMLRARQDSASGLLPTAETPADDPVAMPYHLSSHILLWYTLRRIGRLLADAGLFAWAEQLRAATRQHFTADYGGRALLAYLTDGHGHHHLYHDANDLPLVLAPIWGFCEADDPLWRATLEFAFSEANTGGYYTGPLGGLGSIHTPAPWPLGLVQELLYARLIGDNNRATHVIARLTQMAQWDGALSEACDALSGAVVSRHWFAWPGAALAALLDAAPST
ncbi:MAG: glycoside hydrolase family 125 protein [Anaerolineae bacterium]|nr:glycoside hydrolase family 125 protein [Anaerolineae bacterium]